MSEGTVLIRIAEKTTKENSWRNSDCLIHHGSAESKDGTDRIEAAIERIESRLDAAGMARPRHR